MSTVIVMTSYLRAKLVVVHFVQRHLEEDGSTSITTITVWSSEDFSAIVAIDLYPTGSPDNGCLPQPTT